MCTAFKEYFVNEASLKVAQEDEILLSTEVVDAPPHCLNTLEISKKEILDILNQLNIDKATGIDGISNRILKRCKDELVEPLHLMFNKILQNSSFPNSWKMANVVPI